MEDVVAEGEWFKKIHGPLNMLIQGRSSSYRKEFEAERGTREQLLGHAHLSTVRIVGNLCYGCPHAQDLARECELIPLLLNSAKIFPDSPFVKVSCGRADLPGC